eukprot:832467-Prymnesium_polylepis.1
MEPQQRRGSGAAAGRQRLDSGAAAARAAWWHGATRGGLVVWSDSWAERSTPSASDTQRGAVCAPVGCGERPTARRDLRAPLGAGLCDAAP